MRRSVYSRPICGAAGLVAFGLLQQASATNLLLNPGFEAPADPANNVDSLCTGWTFQFDCQRSHFPNVPPRTADSTWSVWAKTFEALGGGITQNVSIVPSTSYSLSAYEFFQDGYSGSGATIQLGMIWLDNSDNPVGTPTALNIDPSSNPPTNAWQQFTISGDAPSDAAKVMVSLGWSGGQSSPTQPQSVFFDDVDLEGAGTPPTGNAWAVDGSGDWNVTGNWSAGTVPTGVGAEADLLDAISANRTVFTDSAITLGTLTFNNVHTYVVTGAGSLTLQANGSASAEIDVQQGTQKLNLPTTLASNTILNVAAGATLIIADPITINSGKTLNATGPGTVTYQSIINVLGGGAIAFSNSTHTHELDIAATGAATISGSSSVLTVDTLSNGGKIDVKNNKMIVAYGNQADPSASIQSQLTSGYNGGAWNGNGINTSSATSHTGVGWKDDTTGKNVTVKYTYYGDTDLSGTVTTADFTKMSQNFGASAANAIWANGDFNYDGKINALDFNAIAINFGAAPIPAGGLGSVVPEPMSIALLAPAAALIASRRRRRT